MPCSLCQREVSNMTRHHLIPRTRNKNKKTKKMFSAEERHTIIKICHPCHQQVHAVLTEKELERNHRTIESLASHPEINKFIHWINKMPDGFQMRARRMRGR